MKKDKRKIIYLRGHHLNMQKDFLLNKEAAIEKILKLEGEYGENFVKNAIKIHEMIAGEDVKVKIIAAVDDFCQFCRMRQNRRCDPLDSEILDQDKSRAHIYGLKIGRVYTTKHIKWKLGIAKK